MGNIKAPGGEEITDTETLEKLRKLPTVIEKRDPNIPDISLTPEQEENLRITIVRYLEENEFELHEDFKEIRIFVEPKITMETSQKVRVAEARDLKARGLKDTQLSNEELAQVDDDELVDVYDLKDNIVNGVPQTVEVLIEIDMFGDGEATGHLELFDLYS